MNRPRVQQHDFRDTTLGGTRVLNLKRSRLGQGLTVGPEVGLSSCRMETIQVVLDSKLLRAADEAARRARVNRSTLIRKALREHLERLELQELEDQDRRGYREQPDRHKEAAAWERAAAWPE